VSNKEHQQAYKDRELEKGRKRRTTTPLYDHEWAELKAHEVKIKSERKAL
jgi:hypothetical protein